MSQKMRLNTSPKSVAFGLKTLSAAVISALLFANASAAGLGKMTVLSALGQPLRAEIELTSVTSDEAGQLNPKLASIEAYRKASIDFNPALYALHFAVEQRGGGRQVISVTSVQPINDPFVDMLLELGGTGSGNLVREYTFLLDPPPELHNNQIAEVSTARPLAPLRNSQNPAPAQVQAPARTTQPEEQTMSDRPSQTARVPRAPQERPIKPAVTPPAAAQNTAQEGDYHVKSGDSLSKIAGQVKPDGVSLDQMLVALFRANQGAFIGNNMNRLRAGQVLSVPDAATAGAISNGEAHGVIVAQTADFNEYRNKLAGQVVNSEAQKSTEPRQSASGKVTAKIEEKSTAAAEAKDKLKLSKAGAAGEKGGKIAPGEEDKIAKEKALAEANARVKDLEKNVSDLQKVLEVKNKSLSEQQKADAAKAATKPAAAPLPAPVVPTPAPTPVAAATSAPKPAAAATAPAPAAPAPAPAAAPEVKAPVVASAIPPSRPPKPKPRPIPPPETSLLDDLLGNPLVWGGIAVLLGGAGGFSIYNGYRKRKEKSFGDSILTDSSLKANSLFGSTGGQSVDTNNSVFNSNFAPSASQLDSNEVDPVAEADVYIAYGRDAQAEEILKEALRTQPDRNAVRVKLLEIYANRKDVRSFEVLASELYGLTKGEGEDWQQAASLGLSIDPKNPLYAAGKVSNDATTLAGGHTQPLEEPDLDDLVPNTHTRPSMESPNTLEESPYFGSTTLGRIEPDTIARHPETQSKAPGEELPPLNVNTSTSLDFDLDGMDAEHVDLPAEPAPATTIHTPVAAAPATEHRTDFGSVDFDFIDETPAKPGEPTHHVAPAPDLAEDFPSIPVAPAHHVEAPVPSLPEVAAMEMDHSLIHTPAPTPAETKALDFDLSGITLELDQPGKSAPAVAKAAEDHSFDLHVPDIPSVDFHAPEVHTPELHAPELHAMDLQFPESHPSAEAAPAHRSEPTLDMVPDLIAHGHSEAEVALDTGVDHEYSNNAEMATKLDLAVAYQEIGDKEGARELLEEVIHGGVSEHSEKAKAILAKLG